MKFRIAALCGIFAALFVCTQAQAAIWAWGCIGSLDGKQVAFTRNMLVIVPNAAARGPLADMIHKDIELKNGEEGEAYDAQNDNSGFERAMEFKKQSENRETLTLSERSSRVVKAIKGRAGPRDEFITTFRKVYRMTRADQPAHDIRMECMEYILSTKGGRQ